MESNLLQGIPDGPHPAGHKPRAKAPGELDQEHPEVPALNDTDLIRSLIFPTVPAQGAIVPSLQYNLINYLIKVLYGDPVGTIMQLRSTKYNLQAVYNHSMGKSQIWKPH